MLALRAGDLAHEMLSGEPHAKAMYQMSVANSDSQPSDVANETNVSASRELSRSTARPDEERRRG